MSTPESVVQQFTQALQSGNIDAVTSLFAGGLKTNLDRSGITTNLESPATLADAGKNLQDANVKILDTVASGDKVAVRFQYTLDGDDVEGATPGSKTTVTALCIAKVQNGKVVEANIEQDTAGALLALGFGIADA